jgi:signal transduction histidine kinase
VKVHRPLAVLAVAALAPALALCVLQYRSLAELKTKTAATARESLHQVLAASTRRFEADIQELAAGVLNPIAAPEPPDSSELVSRFGGARRAHPAIHKAFLVSQCVCKGEPFAVLSSDGVTSLHEPLRSERMQPILRAFREARSTGESLKYYAESGGVPLIYAFRILDPKRVVFVGLAIDASAILLQVLPRPAAEPVAFSLVYSGGRHLWDSGKPMSGSEAEIRFGPLAAAWTLQASHTGATIESLANRQFERGIGLMALVMMCLVFGTAMTVRAANREARAAAMQSAFIANISHEMKTPLSLIRMFSETLQMGRISDPGRRNDYYEMLHRESRRLTSLIENVLEFGRMDAGRKEYRMAPGSVAAVVEQVLRSYELQLRDGGFECKMEAEAGLPLISFDAEALTQAVGNLVENAMKYSGDPKNIDVSVVRKGAEIAVEVKDSGIGIPHSEQHRIFDRFYRASSPLVHNTKGSGLGLAIARHIVEAHGGQITVESALGEGSRFTMLLPAPWPAVVETQGAELWQRS